MRLAWGDEEEAFRRELVSFLDANVPDAARAYADFATADAATVDVGEHKLIPQWARQWQATLFDAGWMVPAYPPELGGRNASPVQTMIYLEEMASRGVPRSLHFPGYAIVAPSLLEFGTPEQKALAPAAIRGDTIWCIGMSEPGAGSDLASLTTRAVLDGERFVVNGQKVWTSYAMAAQKCFCYVRTDTTVAKHKGITVLIVDMDTPGIDIRPLRHLTGAAEFAEVFFTDVEVPVSNVVGGINDGWRITMGSLAHERGGLWVQSVALCERLVRDLATVAREQGLDNDAGVRRRIAAAYEEAASLRALGYKGFASFAQGSSAPEHSYMKLATSELQKRLLTLGTDLLGPWGAVGHDPRSGGGRWMRSLFVSFANTIAGGSSEIQRNIIAQRVLGLPKG